MISTAISTGMSLFNKVKDAAAGKGGGDQSPLGAVTGLIGKAIQTIKGRIEAAKTKHLQAGRLYETKKKQLAMVEADQLKKHGGKLPPDVKKQLDDLKAQNEAYIKAADAEYTADAGKAKEATEIVKSATAAGEAEKKTVEAEKTIEKRIGEQGAAGKTRENKVQF